MSRPQHPQRSKTDSASWVAASPGTLAMGAAICVGAGQTGFPLEREFMLNWDSISTSFDFLGGEKTEIREAAQRST